MREKQRGMRFFFSVIECYSRALLIHFSPVNYLLCENYPLSTTQGDCFASCENVVSRSIWGTIPGKIHGLNFKFII